MKIINYKYELFAAWITECLKYIKVKGSLRVIYTHVMLDINHIFNQNDFRRKNPSETAGVNIIFLNII